MANTGSAGIDHQEKILDALVALKKEIDHLRESTNLSTDQEMARQVVGSTQQLIEQLNFVEEEARYFFELVNCKNLMLQDNLTHIKQLEEQIAELKLQIR